MAESVQGIDAVIARLDGFTNPQRMRQAVTKATLLVERQAKINAQALSEGDGTLAGSIASRIDDYSGEVYTPLFYAPYVEFGTGLGAFEENGSGNGRTDVPWVYVKGSGKEGGAQRSYTPEEAAQTVAYLRAKGLDAYMTYGQKPQPFMRPALDDNRDKITEILKDGLL